MIELASWVIVLAIGAPLALGAVAFLLSPAGLRFAAGALGVVCLAAGALIVDTAPGAGLALTAIGAACFAAPILINSRLG